MKGEIFACSVLQKKKLDLGCPKVLDIDMKAWSRSPSPSGTGVPHSQLPAHRRGCYFTSQRQGCCDPLAWLCPLCPYPSRKPCRI